MQINNPTPPDRMYTDDGEMIRCKKIEIGSWNMDTTSTKTITHGLSDITKIIHISGIVWDDISAQVFCIGGSSSISAGDTPFVTFLQVDPTLVYVARVVGGPVDSIDFTSIVINRGFLFLWYLG